MKISVNQFNLLPLILITTHVVITHVACSKKDFISSDTSHEERFPSASFNHFEGGVLFTDVELGLEVLWQASFKDGNAYKENLGFFVHGGLLILPNKYNTCGTARLSALPTKTDGGKLYVRFAGNDIKVFGMIHTHPDVHTRREPTPRNDYQYCYLGIHNYVMDHLNLFDAYKDANRYEVYERLGPRNAYHKIPLNELTGAYNEIFALEE